MKDTNFCVSLYMYVFVYIGKLLDTPGVLHSCERREYAFIL